MGFCDDFRSIDAFRMGLISVEVGYEMVAILTELFDLMFAHSLLVMKIDMPARSNRMV